MTEDIIKRRLKLAGAADRVVLPGRYRGDLERLSAHFGVPFVAARTRSPTCRPSSAAPACRPTFRGTTSASLPRSSKRRALDRGARGAGRRRSPDAGRRCDRPRLPSGHAVSACLARRCGTEGRGLLGQRRFRQPRRTCDRRPGRGGLLLSLDENTLPLAFDDEATPVLIPSVPGDLDSLGRAIEPRSAQAFRSSPIRSSTRSISASPHRSAASSSCAAAGRTSSS